MKSKRNNGATEYKLLQCQNLDSINRSISKQGTLQSLVAVPEGSIISVTSLLLLSTSVMQVRQGAFVRVERSE